MGLIELIIVILVLLWLFGYFGPGRAVLSRPAPGSATWLTGNWIHTLLVIALVLIILRVLRLI